MSVVEVPRALVERLGADGAKGLSAMFEKSQAEWTEDVLTLASERFERQLVSAVSTLRVELVREVAGLRQGLVEEVSALRENAGRQVADARVDLLKWSFLFWIGQVAATAGLLAFMLRGLA